jgi:hypothetical protein
MRPTISRDTLRRNTAYSGGRAVANVILLLSCLGSLLIIGVVVIRAQRGPLQELDIILLSSGVVGVLATWLTTAVANAIFDIADASLERRDFKQSME